VQHIEAKVKHKHFTFLAACVPRFLFKKKKNKENRKTEANKVQ